MNYKGIVFFDYDGTLADETEGIYYPTHATKEAISRLRQNGYLSVLATGRSLCYIPDVGVDFGGYVVSNGSYAEADGMEIYQNFIPTDDVKELVDAFENMGLFYSMENQRKCYAKDVNEPIFKAMIDNFNISADVFQNLNEGELPDISKLLVVYSSLDEHRHLSEMFKDKFTFAMHRKYLSADVQPTWINKSVGARRLAEYFDINPENIYAFGDGTNDYELLDFAGHGIAMEYHADVLDKVCEYVTDTVKNEGIYKALVHYGLI